MADNRMIINDGVIKWFDGPEWDDVVEDVFRNAAPRVETAAQQNAPWADRTGRARAGLRASVDRDGGEVTLSLAHTVEYGLWLEVIQAGNFAIIMPTIEEQAPEIFSQAAQAVLNARKGVNL